MSADGQGTKWRRNIAENFNRLSRVHERYRRRTDWRQHYSERQFMFAKKVGKKSRGRVGMDMGLPSH